MRLLAELAHRRANHADMPRRGIIERGPTTPCDMVLHIPLDRRHLVHDVTDGMLRWRRPG